MNLTDIMTFYKGKKVFITGHTGFKGSWLCEIMHMAHADVMGYGLMPNTVPSLYELANIDSKVASVIGDIRDYSKLQSVFNEFKPEIVLHLAAQP